MREMRNENEQRRQERNFLRCRIIPTTKNIYGRRFLCSRLESGICALPLRRLFFGEPPSRRGGSRPFTFVRRCRRRCLVSLRRRIKKNEREGRDRCYVLHGGREMEEMHKFLTP